MSSNFSDFWQKNHDWVAETSLYGFRVFWARRTVSPGKNFPISFWLWAKVFRASDQKVRKPNQNCTLCVQRRFLKEKIFRLKSFFSISLWNWVDDFQDSGGKCRKYHQSCILPVQTNILPKNVFGEKEINTCGFSGKNLRISAGKCLEEFSEGTNSAKKGNSNPSLYLGEKASNFSPKVPSKAVRTAFYVSKGWIPGKKRKYTVLWFSRTPRKSFLTLCEEFFAGLSIMHYTHPRGVFVRNFCLNSAPHNHGFQAITDGGLLHKNFR